MQGFPFVKGAGVHEVEKALIELVGIQVDFKY